MYEHDEGLICQPLHVHTVYWW